MWRLPPRNGQISGGSPRVRDWVRRCSVPKALISGEGGIWTHQIDPPGDNAHLGRAWVGPVLRGSRDRPSGWREDAEWPSKKHAGCPPPDGASSGTSDRPASPAPLGASVSPSVKGKEALLTGWFLWPLKTSPKTRMSRGGETV